MKTLLRCVPLTALLWAGLARGQAPPGPPPPLPAPLPAPPPPAPPPAPPASGDVTGVRQPDTAAAPIDQGPDTLPSLDEEPVAPAPVVRPKAPRARPARPLPPVRADRRLALLGELGWNGLAGFGAIVAFHANPHVTFDLGAGLGAVGGKLGLRARYNFMTDPVTPFIGVGFIGATGWNAPTSDLDNDEANAELNIRVRPSAFLQTVAGIDWTSRNGFTLIGALGYAFMLTRDNIVIITGVPTDEDRRGLDIAFRSGIVISIAIGYSFR
jgi:hypothetical protein